MLIYQKLIDKRTTMKNQTYYSCFRLRFSRIFLVFGWMLLAKYILKVIIHPYYVMSCLTNCYKADNDLVGWLVFGLTAL